MELKTTTLNCNENMQQATLIEKEKFTQMQWDTEELRRKCLEVELRLKTEQVWLHITYRSFVNCNLALTDQVNDFQEEKALLESEKVSLIQEREMLFHELDNAREQLSDLHKHYEEFEAKSKADVKLLVKEVKSLRSSQSELKREFSRLLKEKVEVEVSVCFSCKGFHLVCCCLPLYAFQLFHSRVSTWKYQFSLFDGAL